MSQQRKHGPTGVSLFLPTRNAGPEFPQVLARMLDQELDSELEVLITDSGSTDGTAEFLRDQPVDLQEIPAAEFNHGLTRNAGIRRAKGEIVILATQDAMPVDRHWIHNLVRNYEDPAVAGVYSGQTLRVDANPFVRHRLDKWAASGTKRHEQRVDSPAELASLAPLERLGRIAFDNVSSSVRRSVALEHPFRQLSFGEDLDWAHRVIQDGHSIVFEPGSRVVHSHDNSIWYETKRVYLDHQNLRRLLDVHTVRRWIDVLGCTWLGVPPLSRAVWSHDGLSLLERLVWQVKTVPYSLGQNLGQFLGARSVARPRLTITAPYP